MLHKLKGGNNLKYLIVVDMQNDFITGALGSREAQAIVSNVVAKIEKYRQATYGWMLSDELPIDTYSDQHVYKHTFGYCGWSHILDRLSLNTSQDTIEIVGLCTDICVISNALLIRATFPDISIIVDASCCAGTSIEAHKSAINVMRSCQIDVINEV